MEPPERWGEYNENLTARGGKTLAQDKAGMRKVERPPSKRMLPQPEAVGREATPPD